jgi:peptide/nickel transport system substrate-binding protein
LLVVPLSPLLSRLRLGAAFALLSVALGACTDPHSATPPGVLVVSQEQHASWVRNFNPLLAPGMARWPTSAGIYEPLLIYNPMIGDFVPWLATAYRWGENALSLEFEIRGGVRWSDGEPMTAEDVAFTFGLTRAHPALDIGGVWSFIERVETPDAGRVVLHFQRPYTPGLSKLASQPIVPKHIWEGIEDPVSFTNPEPVATGPFTEVRRFEHQLWEIGRNPNYWQPGKPAVEALRFPAIPGNEQATQALIFGQIDWAGNFVPAIERTFVARDPEHHHYWFPQVAGSIFLFPSQRVPALRDLRVRKAISMAVDREMVVKVAMHGYTRPALATGLSTGYQRWRSEELERSGDWLTHDPAGSEALLDEAGYARRGPGGLRTDESGEPLRLEINSVTGWSDWVRAVQVIARNLQAVGIETRVRNFDFGAWLERVQRGDFDLSLGWVSDGPSPHGVYASLMAQEEVKAVGETATVNWHRFGNPEVDGLLASFESTASFEEQRALMLRVQEIFIEQAPAIPVFLNPSWGEYNSTRFTGFPNAEDPYARLSPNHPPEPLLVMVRLEPRSP